MSHEGSVPSAHRVLDHELIPTSDTLVSRTINARFEAFGSELSGITWRNGHALAHRGSVATTNRLAIRYFYLPR
jgi:hypothetical protein